ncbi:hypothetical protein HOL21_01960 [Candidatus Woesearchaeota archaeon]|jgi:rRNA-processing protein FCF1|nr:hypothetical protein [Candidatus Woesearchaeota archaeon]MBT5396958.1 hypothetical protein [Candidatus Woesearchaeota archaeon]MBT5924182.1 hypothetical protein [Candidatus Woesearchaeota archaeon]MBT6367151.1 hypothetical protein [Candidatus Woesearchaeota archaeon]MBT7762275.1 hypothetical protein [Candidatus Woesearchaeota archaeon]
MKTILIDTNALMALVAFKIDIFSALERDCDFPFRVAVLQGTLDELEKIQNEQRGKYARAAKLAFEIAKAKKIPIIKSSGDVDDLLVEYSKKEYLVLTQDVELKKRLQKPYLTIRQKRMIVIVN